MRELKIACLGDIMCGDSFFRLGSGVAASLDKYGKNFLPNDITDFLKLHDLVFANIESPVSDKARKNHSMRSLHMRARPQTAQLIADWNINIANVANNHILEHGVDVAVDTVNNLNNAGIKTIGHDSDNLFNKGMKIQNISSNGLDLAFIGICLCNEKYAFTAHSDLNELIETTRSLSDQNKIVCISIHWGDEFMDRPNHNQINFAHSLVDAGASIIIGHHSHVVQAVEKYKNALIAYSMGNFIFDCYEPDCCWSMVLSININDQKNIDYYFLPIQIDSHHRPFFAKDTQKTILILEIKRRCSLLHDNIDQCQFDRNYQNDFKQKDLESRAQLRSVLQRSLLNINPVFWPQILFRPVRRRLGLW